MHHFVVILHPRFGINRIFAVRADREATEGDLRRFYRADRLVHQVPEADLTETLPFEYGKQAEDYIEKFRDERRRDVPLKILEYGTASRNPGKKSPVSTGGVTERMSFRVVEMPRRK